MSDTPRTTDRVVFIDGNPWVNAPFAVRLELELKAANERIKRLEEAGDALYELCDPSPIQFDLVDQIPQRLKAWEEAKEDKP